MISRTVLRFDYLLFLTRSILAAVTLSPCVNDGDKRGPFAEVIRGQSTQFYCRGFQAGNTVAWRYTSSTTGDVPAATCNPLISNNPADCQGGNLGSTFSARRTSDTESVMTVNAAGIVSAVTKGTLGCRISTASTATTCKMDLITPGQGTCNVTFYTRTRPWQTVGQCDITTAESTEGRYHCRWYRTRGSSQEGYRNQVAYYGPVPGTCRFNESLPADDGRYSYRVKVTPGEVSITASFTGDQEIKRPSAPSVTGCSQTDYIPENTAVRCTCSKTNVGKPAGQLQWHRIGTSNPLVTGDASNNTLVLSQILGRSDHKTTRFRCNLKWATDILGQELTFNVGYKPEKLTLEIDSTSQTEKTVRENATVPFTCTAEGRPTATSTLTRPGGSQVASGPSPLSFSLQTARCTDTGLYTCSASNVIGQANTTASVTLYVKCTPRSDSTDLPAINYRNESEAIDFDVTAYPVPDNIFVFKYRGPDGTEDPKAINGIQLRARCRVKSGVEYISTCTVTVRNVTSPQAAGFYTVTVSNGEGSEIYQFQVKYNAPTPPPTPQNDASTGGSDAGAIAGGIVGAVVVIAAIVVVIVFIMKRRRTKGPSKEKLQSSSAAASRPARGYEDMENPGLVPDSERPSPATSLSPLTDQPTAVGDVYAVVNKTKKSTAPTAAASGSEPEATYAVVDKKKKKPTGPAAAAKPKPNDKPKKGKDKKAGKDGAGPVYGNVDLKGNKDKKGKKSTPAPPEETSTGREVNQDGLLYTSVDFAGFPQSSSAPPKPKPDDQTVVYSAVDFNKSAP